MSDALPQRSLSTRGIPIAQSILKCDETAYELFQRMTPLAPFSFRVSPEKSEAFKFGTMSEVLTHSAEVADFVLSVALEFAAQFHREEAVIVHVSLNNSLQNALLQSAMDIAGTPLYAMHQRGRVKGFTISSPIELMAVAELLRTSMQGEKVLLILDSLTALLLLQKSITGTVKPSSLVSSTLRLFQQLCTFHPVIALWVDSVQPKNGGGLREGLARDPLSTLWKQKIPKVVYYNP